MLVGIGIKDLFVGTPEQFSDTFGHIYADDAHPMDILDAIRKHPPHVAVGLPLTVYLFRDEEARTKWFAPGGGYDQIDWDEVVALTGVLKAPEPAPEDPFLVEARKRIKPLVWTQENGDVPNWYAWGIGASQYALWVQPDGTVKFWEEGEGPDYPDVDTAKKAVDEYHREEVLREFFN